MSHGEDRAVQDDLPGRTAWRSRPRTSETVLRAIGAVRAPVVAIAGAVALASVVLWASGFGLFGLVNALGNAFSDNFFTTVRWATPLLLTGVATALAFRARVWNIGLDGQLAVGAIFAAAVAPALATALPPSIALGVVLGTSIIGGAAFAAIPGILRVLAGAPEIVTTVILISVGQQLVSFAVQGPLRSKDAALASSLVTDPIDQRIWLVSLSPSSQATTGLFAALIAVGLVAVYLWRSTWGYEHMVYGENAAFSIYGGVTNRAVFLRAMVISGGLAGLAGGIEVMGVTHALQAGFNPGFGFAGVAVALAARNNPVALVLTALFFGALRSSATFLQLNTNAPSQFVDIVTALVILTMTVRIVRSSGSIRRPRRGSSDDGLNA